MEMGQLEQRLLRLERSVRKWKAMTAGLVLVLVAGVTLGQARPQLGVFDNLTCRQLNVVEGNTTICVIGGASYFTDGLVRIGKDSKGEGGDIRISHTNGEDVIQLSAWKLGGAVDVYNKEGKLTTDISQTDAGGGTVSVRSAKGKLDADLLSGETAGSLYLRNRTDELIVHLGADEYGNGVVSAWDRKGKGRTLKPGP